MFSSSSTIRHFFFFRSTPILLHTGTVQFWNAKGGFGHVKSDTDGKDYFVHNRNCIFEKGKLEKFRSIEQGAHVEFDLAIDAKATARMQQPQNTNNNSKSPKKYCCTNVTMIGGTPLPSGPYMNQFQRDARKLLSNLNQPKAGSENLRGVVSRIWNDGKYGWIRPVVDLDLAENDAKENVSKRDGAIFFHCSSLDPESLKKFGVDFTTTNNNNDNAENPDENKRFMSVEEKRRLTIQKFNEEKKRLEEQEQEALKKQQQPRRRVVVRKVSNDDETSSDQSSTIQTTQHQQQKQPTIIVTSCALKFGDEVLFDVKLTPDHKQMAKKEQYQVSQKFQGVRAEARSAENVLDIGGSMIENDDTSNIAPSKEDDTTTHQEQGEENFDQQQQQQRNNHKNKRVDPRHTRMPIREKNTIYRIAASNIRLVKRPLSTELLVGCKGIRGTIEFINYSVARRNEIGKTKELISMMMENAKNKKNNAENEHQQQETDSYLQKRKQERELQKYLNEVSDLPPLPWGFVKIDPASVPKNIIEDAKKNDKNNLISSEFNSIFFELPNYLADESELVIGTKVKFDVQEEKSWYREKKAGRSQGKTKAISKPVCVNLDW